MNLSTVVMGNPGWHGERHVQVGNLSASTRVNGAGRLSCYMSVRDAHACGFDALLGRWIWWQGSAFTWAGFVEDLSPQIDSGTIEISCTEMGGLLDLMTTPRTYRQISSSPGALIGRTIRDSGADTGSWFRTLVIDEDGAPITIEWRGEQTGTVVQSLANRAGGAWYVTIDEDKSLTFTYQAKPLDMRGSVLVVEGLNMFAGTPRAGISNLVNDLLAISNDRNWQRASGARVVNEKSIRLYDRRKGTKRYEGHTHPSSLETAARFDLATLSVPSGPVSLDTTACNPIVSSLRIGTLVRHWSVSQSKVYDLTILGLAHDTSRSVVTVVGTIVEAD